MANFCIRCGNQLLADHPLCPRCGMNAENPQIGAPIPPQYSAPAQPQYSAPMPPQYSAPMPPQYSAPMPPQYSAPMPPQYAAPMPPQYAAPMPPQYAAPMPPQYAAPMPPQYGVQVPLYSGPVTAKERRRARRAAFDDSHLPLYGVEQWPEEGIPEGALDPKPAGPQAMRFPMVSPSTEDGPAMTQAEDNQELVSDGHLPPTEIDL